MPDRYAVIGNPIAHSQSPRIHTAFARATDQDLLYERMLGNLDDFAGDVARFFASGGCGLNVTLPFKTAAWALADERTARAEIAGAVNTLIRLGGNRLRGDNTDGIGLVRDLADRYGFQFQGARVLLVGAGGAARGVLVPLLETGLDRLVIANRTPEKAAELALLGAEHGSVRACDFNRLASERFDLIINATPAGLNQQVPPIPSTCLAPDGWTYDMLYADEPTSFCRWGQQQGAARSLDGLGMLVEQAAESFWLWRGIRPDTAGVYAVLRGARAQR
ncbi:shikimate dehydrogenase [Thiocapsa imhoffii]|uniref:Shikimate dehydrogenase (NADP(+)) n=1 Tax=Thiocapsa imhoffii TaxID=382777 RepID=A0A9X1BB36_9GAMM|nr:shikimate dehydrogenase [Thiocapsa imhoffii]MBK1646415.1 shikimate dehydrogenase [Thiocapsa imhoffii]